MLSIIEEVKKCTFVCNRNNKYLHIGVGVWTISLETFIASDLYLGSLQDQIAD